MKNRRNFLKAGLLSSVIFVASKGELLGATTTLSILKAMQQDLLHGTDAMPSYEQINPNKYLLIIFNHSRIGDDEKEYLRNGARWLNEEALEMYEKPYASLDADKRQRVLISFSSHDWGESYIYKVLSYMMESMLGDPIYGGNKNGSGWKFLGHRGGQPSPKKAYL